jgi:hypothetical protein
MGNLKFQINNIHNTHSRSTSTTLTPDQHPQHSIKINIHNTQSRSISTTLTPDQHPHYSLRINIHNPHSRSTYATLSPHQHPQHSSPINIHNTHSRSTSTTLTPDQYRYPHHSFQINIRTLTLVQHTQHLLQITIHNTRHQHSQHSLQINIHNTLSRSISTTLSPDQYPKHLSRSSKVEAIRYLCHCRRVCSSWGRDGTQLESCLAGLSLQSVSTFPQNTQKFEAIILRGKHLVFLKSFTQRLLGLVNFIV